MSQHRVHKQDIMAMIGYDRPTHSYYLTITKDWETDDPKDVYCSMGKKIERSKMLDTFLQHLKDHGFSINDDFKECLVIDAMFQVMNTISFWKYDSEDNLVCEQTVTVGQ